MGVLTLAFPLSNDRLVNSFYSDPIYLTLYPNVSRRNHRDSSPDQLSYNDDWQFLFLHQVVETGKIVLNKLSKFAL
jgi:hypothetical protein